MASYPSKSGNLNIFLSSGQGSPGILSFDRCQSLVCAVRYFFFYILLLFLCLWIDLYMVINIGFGNIT